MNQDELLSYCLTEKNKELWDLLNKEFNILVESSFEPNYLISFKDDIITLYVDENELNSASFTHELLHVELKRKGVLISKELNDRISESDELFSIFSKDLKDHIGNCLEHIKMMPLFEKMGYERSEFISDYSVRKMNNNILNRIKLNYKDGKVYNRDVVDLFIGKFFAMKACFNSNFKYNKYFFAFSRIDKTLLRALSEFWDDWMTFDIEDKEDDYDEILEYFIEDLKEWVDRRTVK